MEVIPNLKFASELLLRLQRLDGRSQILILLFPKLLKEENFNKLGKSSSYCWCNLYSFAMPSFSSTKTVAAIRSYASFTYNN